MRRGARDKARRIGPDLEDRVNELERTVAAHGLELSKRAARAKPAPAPRTKRR